MISILKRSLFTLGLGLGAFLPVAPADADTTQVQLMEARDGIQVDLSYQRDGTGRNPSDRFRYSQSRLAIGRDGAVVFDEPLPLSASNNGAKPLIETLEILDLDNDGELEILFDVASIADIPNPPLYSLIYRYHAEEQIYLPSSQEWGPAGYLVQDRDQDEVVEFLTGDRRFESRFGSRSPLNPELQLQSANFPGAVLPLQIFRFEDGQFINVTRDRAFQTALYSHSYNLWLTYWAALQQGNTTVRTDPNMKSIWAAYLADKYLLGQEASGWRIVEEAYQAGDRDQFFADLRQFLQETGYTTAAARP